EHQVRHGLLPGASQARHGLFAGSSEHQVRRELFAENARKPAGAPRALFAENRAPGASAGWLFAEEQRAPASTKARHGLFAEGSEAQASHGLFAEGSEHQVRHGLFAEGSEHQEVLKACPDERKRDQCIDDIMNRFNDDDDDNPIDFRTTLLSRIKHKRKNGARDGQSNFYNMQVEKAARKRNKRDKERLKGMELERAEREKQRAQAHKAADRLHNKLSNHSVVAGGGCHFTYNHVYKNYGCKKTFELVPGEVWEEQWRTAAMVTAACNQHEDCVGIAFHKEDKEALQMDLMLWLQGGYFMGCKGTMETPNVTASLVHNYDWDVVGREGSCPLTANLMKFPAEPQVAQVRGKRG
ncbi:hypothetical protein CYMTET_15670, partial [Cymbomonas tetramitiformis]